MRSPEAIIAIGHVADLARGSCRSGRSPWPSRTSARRRRSRACTRRSASRSASVGELAAVALGADEVDGVERLDGAHARAPLNSASSRGPNASGSTSSIVRMPDTVSSSIPGRVLVQQLPAAAARHQRVAVAVDARERDELAAARHARAPTTSAHSAHSVTPYDAFSTLQPRHDAAVVDERGGADRELASTARTPCAIASRRAVAQRVPVDRSVAVMVLPFRMVRLRCRDGAASAQDLMYGLPAAAGPRPCRPGRPRRRSSRGTAASA